MIDVTRWRLLVADMPLCVLDTECTDKDAETAGICELAAVGYDAASIEAAIAASAGGAVVVPTPAWQTDPAWRCNPGAPSKPGALRAHGIRDEELINEPDAHTKLAGPLVGLSAGYRVAGYNSNSFDLAVIRRVVGVEFPHAFDVMGVVAAARQQPALEGVVPWNAGGPIAMFGIECFKDKLGAIYAALTAQKLAGAHGALVDAKATATVLFMLLALYPGIPADGPALTAAAEHALCMVQDVDGVPTFVRGKHEGDSVVDVELADASYIGWLLDAADMDEATKSAVVSAIGEARAVQIMDERRRRSAPKPGRPRKPKGDAGAAA